MIRFLLDTLFLKNEIVKYEYLSPEDIKLLTKRRYEISSNDDDRFYEMIASTCKKYKDLPFCNVGRFNDVLDAKTSNDSINVYYVGRWSLDFILFVFPNELCLMFDNWDNISIHHLSHLEKHHGSEIRRENLKKFKDYLQSLAPCIDNAVTLGFIKPKDLKSELFIKLWRLI